MGGVSKRVAFNVFNHVLLEPDLLKEMCVLPVEDLDSIIALQRKWVSVSQVNIALSKDADLLKSTQRHTARRGKGRGQIRFDRQLRRVSDSLGAFCGETISIQPEQYL